MQCCPTTPARQVPRDINEYARDVARRTMRTKAFLKSRDERKRVEMRFAHLKIHHGFERMRLRGLSSARNEFHLAAIVQNLKTLALRTLRPPAILRPALQVSASDSAKANRRQPHVNPTASKAHPNRKPPTSSTASTQSRHWYAT
jgi:hypothetical protein